MVTSAQYKTEIEQKIKEHLLKVYGSENDAEFIDLLKRAKERLLNWLDNQTAPIFINNIDLYEFAFRVRASIPRNIEGGYIARYAYLDIITEDNYGTYDEVVKGNTIQKQDGLYGYEFTDFVLFKDDGALGTPNVTPAQIYRRKTRKVVISNPTDYILPEIIDNPVPGYSDLPKTSGFNLDSNTILLLALALFGLKALK